MNEPSIFERADKTMPLDTVHYVDWEHNGRVDRRKADHREIHNVLGMENVHATHDGLLALQPDIRPLVLTRAAYAGTQRYAATWTGDNAASWNQARISIPQIMNLGVSGYAFAGADVGGFRGSPTPELLTRWMELGAFTPFYRNHGEVGSRNREPWVDGAEQEAIRRKYIETRYKLLPYIYTSMEETSRTGVPPMRPLFMEFPEVPILAGYDQAFMLGNDLLVAPKVYEFAKPYLAPMPRTDWYDYWTGEKVTGAREFMGVKVVDVDPPLDTLPVYVRAGAIIPQQPVVQHVEEAPAGPLEVRVYAGADCRGDLYSDDGNTNAYLRGEFVRVHFTCEVSGKSVKVNVGAPEGPYKPWYQEVQVVVYGTGGQTKEVVVDGKPVTGWKLKGGGVALPPFAWNRTAHSVEVRAQ